MKKNISTLLSIILTIFSTSAKLPFTQIEDECIYTSNNDYISGSDILTEVSAFIELDFIEGKEHTNKYFIALHIDELPESESIQENVPCEITFLPFRGYDITLKGNLSVGDQYIYIIPNYLTSHSHDPNFSKKTYKARYQEIANIFSQYPIKSVKVRDKLYNLELPPAGNPVLPNMKPSSTAISIQGATLYDKYDNDFFSSSFTASIFPEKTGVTVDGLKSKSTFNNPMSTIEWQTCNLGAASNPLNTGSRVSLAEAKKRCPAGWRLPTLKDYRELFYDNHVSYEIINGQHVALFTYGVTILAIPYGTEGLMLWTADSYPDYGMQGAANFINTTGRYDQFTCDGAPAEGANIFVRYVRDKK